MARPPSHRTHRHSVTIHYPRTVLERAWGLFVAPALFIVGLFLLIRFSGFFPAHIGSVSLHDLTLTSFYTLERLTIAYVCALVCGVPLAIIVTRSPIVQKIFLPVFDILQSVPILAFFPIIIVIFLSIGFTNGAAIFIIFLSMLWNIVFAVAGGVGLIPKDIDYAARVFGIRGGMYLRRVLLPSLVPQIVVGSILAVAQGWNIIIVAEVIRTYLPATSPIQNLNGLGSTLVYAAAQGDTALFLAALASTVFIIAVINLFIWQRLLRYAQRFKFE